jgi:GNAT superfamily N-acetyltransferase
MEAGKVVVRLAGDGDLTGILALYEQLADGRPNALPAGREASAELLRTISSQPGRSLLVAVEDGAVRGVADGLVVPNLTHGGKPWMIVENVIVDAGRRRTGIGRALMDELLRVAQDAGCYKIQLLSRKGRSEAHAFYEVCGFEPVAEGFRRYFESPTR